MAETLATIAHATRLVLSLEPRKDLPLDAPPDWPSRLKMAQPKQDGKHYISSPSSAMNDDPLESPVERA